MTSGPAAEKITVVERELSRLESVVVAFSGGVDSSLLLALAVRALGTEGVLAVTAAGAVVSAEDSTWAHAVADRLGVNHTIVPIDYLAIPGFADNTPERCYVCRRRLYATLEEIRSAADMKAVVDGAIIDDSDDYRPGLRAAAEAGVRSPLAEAGLTKAEVRVACRALGLPVWQRPASPCLASRFPYGELITPEKVEMVAQAEAWLRERGFAVARVRHHGALARVEVPIAEIPRLSEEPLRGEVVEALRSLGYVYICLDLLGFRSGSLNEGLQQG